MLTKNGTYQWSFVTQIFHNGQPTFKVMTSTYPIGSLGSVASLLAATLYQGNRERKHKLWNIVSTERYAGAAGMLLHMNGNFTMGKLKSSLLS